MTKAFNFSYHFSLFLFFYGVIIFAYFDHTWQMSTTFVFVIVFANFYIFHNQFSRKCWDVRKNSFQQCVTNGWFLTYKIVVWMFVISLFTYKILKHQCRAEWIGLYSTSLRTIDWQIYDSVIRGFSPHFTFLFVWSEPKRIWILFASYSHVSVYSKTPFIRIIRFTFASK